MGHMQVCTSLQTHNHASTQPLCFFTGWMPFLLPNQQCQSTEGTRLHPDSNSKKSKCKVDETKTTIPGITKT